LAQSYLIFADISHSEIEQSHASKFARVREWMPEKNLKTHSHRYMHRPEAAKQGLNHREGLNTYFPNNKPGQFCCHLLLPSHMLGLPG
jgi:hypothetical protein